MTIVCGSLLPLIGAEPARAHDYARERSGSAFWAPDWTMGTSQYVDQLENALRWSFQWDHGAHQYNLGGQHRAIEMKARVEVPYADDYGSYEDNNFPSGTTPYKDTLQSGGGGSIRNFGYGAVDIGGGFSLFEPGVAYEATVTVYKTLYVPDQEFGIEWAIYAATKKSHQPTGCAPTVAFCSFDDYQLILQRSEDFSVTQDETFSQAHETNGNLAYNWQQYTNFEHPAPADPHYYWWRSWSNCGDSCNEEPYDGDLDVRCEGESGAGVAFQGSCYGWFKNIDAEEAGAGFNYGWISGDSSYIESGDEVSASMLLWCGADPGQTCNFDIEVEAFNTSTSAFEKREIPVEIPGSGTTPTYSGWYLCHVDQEHGLDEPFDDTFNWFTVSAMAPQGVAFGIDDIQLRGFHTGIHSTEGDPGGVGETPICSGVDEYHSVTD